MNMMAAVAVLALIFGAGAQQEKPAQRQDRHQQGVNERGDQVMGFSHDKTTHHFLLLRDGGAIEVTANDAKDTASRDQIRMHLGHIVGMFSAGDFNAPFLIHGVNPPGAAAMKELREQIVYKYEDAERGGRVRIVTRNKKAVDAIHEFLRFQISDHETGDPQEITKGQK